MTWQLARIVRVGRREEVEQYVGRTLWVRVGPPDVAVVVDQYGKMSRRPTYRSHVLLPGCAAWGPEDEMRPPPAWLELLGVFEEDVAPVPFERWLRDSAQEQVDWWARIAEAA